MGVFASVSCGAVPASGRRSLERERGTRRPSYLRNERHRREARRPASARRLARALPRPRLHRRHRTPHPSRARRSVVVAHLDLHRADVRRVARVVQRQRRDERVGCGRPARAPAALPLDGRDGRPGDRCGGLDRGPLLVVRHRVRHRTRRDVAAVAARTHRTPGPPDAHPTLRAVPPRHPRRRLRPPGLAPRRGSRGAGHRRDRLLVRRPRRRGGPTPARPAHGRAHRPTAHARAR